MSTKVILILSTCVIIVGCRANVEIDSAQHPSNRSDDARERDIELSPARNSQDSAWNGDSAVTSRGRSATSVGTKRLPCDGLWIPAGWMGDCELPSGPLQRHVFQDDFRSQPNCEQWTYAPTEENSSQRWCAVAYQYSSGGYNFGDKAGKDLSREGFTHVTFWAKAATAKPARLIVKSGGHTSPGAAYPASYSAELGLVELDNRWQKISVPIGRLNHTNVTCAMAFVLLAENGPCSFLIDDLAFEGP